MRHQSRGISHSITALRLLHSSEARRGEARRGERQARRGDEAIHYAYTYARLPTDKTQYTTGDPIRDLFIIDDTYELLQTGIQCNCNTRTTCEVKQSDAFFGRALNRNYCIVNRNRNSVDISSRISVCSALQCVLLCDTFCNALCNREK
jgi:hypothetical protein